MKDGQDNSVTITMLMVYGYITGIYMIVVLLSDYVV